MKKTTKMKKNIKCFSIKIDLNNYGFFLRFYHQFTELQELDISDMNLDSLPAPLPPTLVKLNCALNKITQLPAFLPATLQILHAFNNCIDSVPATWPAALRQLDLGHNRLTSQALEKTTFPPDVQILCVNHNQLTEIPRLQSLVRLQRLNVSCNALGTLALDCLPATLEFFSCAHNQAQHFTGGPFPAALKYLYASHNQLTAVPLPLPPRLVELELQHNRLTTLGDAALPPQVKYFWCHDNLLKTLPLLSDSVQNINSQNNPLAHRSLLLHGQPQDVQRLNEYIYMHLAQQRMHLNDFRWYLLYHSANICMHPDRIAKLVKMKILSFTDDSFSQV
jgi:Leucine-rich repeat (LRR) protein